MSFVRPEVMHALWRWRETLVGTFIALCGMCSNLMPGMITVHMLMALAIVGALLFPLARSQRRVRPVGPVNALPRSFSWCLYAVLVMTVLQVAMGTQVREMTDFIKAAQGEALRSTWVEYMPWFFYVHRSFSAVVLAANVWLAWLLIRNVGWGHTLTRLTVAMNVVVVFAITSGATLGHLGMPALVQPAHLLSAALLFGLQFLLWMNFRHARTGSSAGGATVAPAGAGSAAAL